MTPRLLIKWKSFWLGVLVLGFLGWAWARSMERDEGITTRGPGVQRSKAILSGGVLSVSHFGGEMDYDSFSAGWHSRTFSKEEAEGQRRWALLLKDPEDGAFWWIAVPMWVPFLCFLMMWSAWLIWHSKREKKKPTA